MYVKSNIFLLSSFVILLGLIFFPHDANAISIDKTPFLYNDSGNLIPYKIINSSNTINLTTKEGSFIFDKNSCSLSVNNSTGSQIIGQDVYSVIASQGNTGVWNPVSVINNAACNVILSKTNETVTLSSSKTVQGAGTFQINYTKQLGVPLKLTFSATNNNPAWTNYHIGMSEQIQVPKILTLGNQTYDLSQHNNTSLSRTWITSHNAQLIHLSSNAVFNMGLGWNHVNDVVIHWINNKASLTIDYNFNTPILSPGNTILIDPFIDVVTAGSGVAAPTSHTLSVTIGSHVNRVLIVGATDVDSAGGGSVSTVKIGSTSFTKAVERTSANQIYSSIWYLVNPPTGSQTITMTTPAGTTDFYSFCAYSLYGVNQTNPIGATSTASASTTSISQSITPTHSGAWIIDQVSSANSGGQTIGSPNLTQKCNSGDLSSGGLDVATASQLGTSPTIGSGNTMSWTASPAVSFQWTATAVEVIPANAPAQPTISKVNTLNSTAINSTWNKPTGTTWFWANFTLSGGATTHINTTATTLTLNNFTAGSKYTLSVVAGNGSGKSSSSLTKYNYTFNLAPTSPTISSILSTQARLSWTNPASGNLTGGFNIYQVTALGTNYTLAATSSNSTNHRDMTSLLGNREYSMKIATRYAVGTNYTGQSSNSTIVTFYTIPGTPTGLTITQSSALHVHLSWTQAVDNGTISGTKIERSTNNGGTWTTIVANTGNSSSTYNDVVSTAGKYTYRVSTIKYGGTSNPSNQVNITIWDLFTVREYHADGVTAVYGQAIQSNSTSTNNRFTLVSGLVEISGLSGNNNFTAWNSLINFIVGKQYNYNATSNHSLNMTTKDFDVDCPSTGTGIDVEVWTNGTNGHNITTFSTPTCFANNTMKWSTKFTANGNDVNSYNTLVYVRAVNATFGTVAPLKYNQTKVTTAFTDPYIVSNPVSVGTGLQTKLFNWSMNLTVSPAFTPVNFTVGHISVSGVNPITAPIKFTTTTINSSASSVTVTFPSTYTMAYKLSYGNEGTSKTYTGLPVTSPSLGLGQTVLTFKNPGNDFVTIKAYDLVSNTTASTILAQPNTNVPFVTQFTNFKNGLFGTSAMIGGINIIDLIVLIVAMIGLNRANEIVGAFMMVIIVGVAGFFQIITWPTAMVSAIALAVLITVVTMKKYQNS